MKSVGIDIGSFSIKIAEIESGSKSLEVTRLQEFPLSQDPSRDRKIEIIDLLRTLFGDYDLVESKFILGLRQSHVSSRIKTFPFRERHKILKSLAFELEDDIPFSLEDAIYEAKITRFRGSSADVFAMASPKERIIELLSLGSDGGLDPDIISVEGIALTNTIEPFLLPPPESMLGETPVPEARSAQILLNIGHEHTVFVVLEDGSLKLIRHIDWGGKQLAEAIARQYSMHYLEALKDLQRKSFLLLHHEGATKDQILLSDTLKAAFDPLIQELKLSILETKSDFHLDYKEMMITGGVANLKNISGFLTQKLDIATNRLSSVSMFPGINLENPGGPEMASVVAVGLAIEGLRRPKNPAVQFLKSEFAKQSQSLQLFLEKWTFTAQIATAAFVFLVIYSYLRDDLATSAAENAATLLKNQATAVADLKGPKATMKAIKDFIDSKKQEEKTRSLADQVQEVVPALDILNRLSSTVPGRRKMNLLVSKFKLEGDQLTVSGEVGTQQEMDTLKNTLINLSIDKTVETVPPPPILGKAAFGFRIKVARLKGS